MARDCIFGKMGGNMKENIKMIKRMARGYTLGQMEENMKESGNMENNMEKENIYLKMVL